LALAYTFKGERTVRNIAKPVRVYRVHMDSEGKASRVHVRRRESLPLRRLAATFAVTLLILAGGVTGWHLLVRSPLTCDGDSCPGGDGTTAADQAFHRRTALYQSQSGS
jgi:hypothetical protein